MGQVVAGVDDEVGLQGGKLTDPLLLASLVWRHVQVGDLEHP
jgi:hypothetical protein